MMTPEERFWSKVEKTEGCWNWTGSKTAKGYGTHWLPKRHRTGAHRTAYEFVNGPIQEGMVIDHICHNRGCVNPRHLRATTPKKNNENRLGANKNSASGVRGVCWSKQKKRWVAQVTHEWKLVHAGFHKTVEEAEAAVIAKRLELFTHNDVDKAA